MSKKSEFWLPPQNEWVKMGTGMKLGSMTLSKMKTWYNFFQKNVDQQMYYQNNDYLNQVVEFEDVKLTQLKRKNIDTCHSNLPNETSNLIDRGALSPSRTMNVFIEKGSFDISLLKAVECSLSSTLSIPSGVHGDIASRAHSLISDVNVLSSGSNGVVFMGKLSGNSKDDNTKDLVVIKAAISKKTNDDIIHETFIGFAATNKLRELVPNFVYTYTYFRCLPPVINGKKKTIDMWCPTPSNNGEDSVIYSVTENLAKNGISMDLYGIFEQYSQIPIDPHDLLSILAQIACALAVAWDKYRFTHYDLHPGNVIISNNRHFPKNGEETVLIPYDLTKEIGDVVFVRSTYMATIIDYGYSYVEIGDRKIGLSNMPHYAMFADRPNPNHDMFKMIGHFLSYVKKTSQLSKYYEAFLTLMEPFTKSAKDADEIVNEGEKYYYFHPLEFNPVSGKIIHSKFPIIPILSAIKKTSIRIANIKNASRKITESENIYASDFNMNHSVFVLKSQNVTNFPILRINRNPTISEKNDMIHQIITSKLKIHTFAEYNTALFIESQISGVMSSNVQNIRNLFNFDKVDETTAMEWSHNLKDLTEIINDTIYHGFDLLKTQNNSSVIRLRIINDAMASARSSAKVLNMLARWADIREAHEISCIASGKSIIYGKLPKILKQYNIAMNKWIETTIPLIKLDNDFVKSRKYKTIDADWSASKKTYPYLSTIHADLLVLYNTLYDRIQKPNWLTRSQQEILRDLAKTADNAIST